MDEFTKALLSAMETAKTVYGIAQPRLLQNIQKYGAVPAVKDYLRRGRLSDGFEALAQQHRLELSMEALAASSKFNGLFTDDEVNACFDALCGKNYF